MTIIKFSDGYLNELLDKLSQENRNVLLLDDFNIKLLNYDIHPLTNEFIDLFSSYYLLPHLLKTNRVTSNSKTLIDSILINIAMPNVISGNLTCLLP